MIVETLGAGAPTVVKNPSVSVKVATLTGAAESLYVSAQPTNVVSVVIGYAPCRIVLVAIQLLLDVQVVPGSELYVS